MDDKQLLAEIDELLVIMPALEEFSKIGSVADIWLGKVNAVLSTRISVSCLITLELFNKAIEQGQYAGTERSGALRGVLRLLNTLRHSLLMASGGTGTIAIDHGMHFEYFDAVRKIIQTASVELFIIDPYLNEDVLSKFCVFAKPGVAIRLLGSRYISTLEPAARALNQQRGSVSLRMTETIHDRFIIVDNDKCFMSGASLKYGPKNAISLISEIVDVAMALISLYETAWVSAQVRI